MEDKINGIIDSIVYANESNGFTVARLNKCATQKESFCIVGNFNKLQIGESITCTGNWSYHNSYGRQFVVSSYEVEIPKDVQGIQRYLESGNIKGIGPVHAKRIVDKFGDKTIGIIDENPMKLIEVHGIGKKRINMIMEYWEEQKSIRSIMIFFQSHGIGSALSKKIYHKYGDESITRLKKNPYNVARDIFGIGFKTADKIAQGLNITLDSPIRIESGIEHVLHQLSDDGHVCFSIEKFLQIAEAMLNVDKSLILSSISSLENEDRIHCSTIDLNAKSTLCIWLKSFYVSERGIAKHIERIISEKCAIRDIKCDEAIKWTEEKSNMSLAKEQIIALKDSLKNKMHIITGGPGTGKSTITKAIILIHEKISKKILLCAPTGRAAKRLSEITCKKAFTIHSLLEYEFANRSFKKNIDNQLECDLIIIDESSMIDTYLMYSLLKAIPSTARVVFIGDIDQLPSVGAGNVLKDLIESGKIPVTKLSKIFRQKINSKIIINAHNINNGIFPELNPICQNNDFAFIELAEPEDIANHIVKLMSGQIPIPFGINPLNDAQVLSPMRKGVIGIENLNILLQKKLNRSNVFINHFGRALYLNDKVMQIRNNYNKEVFNGDVGYICKIDKENMQVDISFDGRIVNYEITKLDEIELAYAVSVHKYQGSESSCIIMPVHTSHYKLLQRNLLYTSITRGKKMVILLGSKQAIEFAVKNDKIKQRETGLSYFISNL